MKDLEPSTERGYVLDKDLNGGGFVESLCFDPWNVAGHPCITQCMGRAAHMPPAYCSSENKDGTDQYRGYHKRVVGRSMSTLVNY